MGRPFVNVAFTEGEDKDTFNRIEPTRDQELFTKKFADILESFGYSPENAQQVALTLLPDILDYDYSTSNLLSSSFILLYYQSPFVRNVCNILLNLFGY
jgi:hypothetical protein